MFSKRLRWDLKPNPISRLLEAKRAAGVHVLDLTESNPTRAGIKYPVAEIVAAFGSADLLRYEPDPLGMRAVREAVQADLLTASTSEAYAFLFKLLTDPGDEILVPRPSYPLFEFLAGMEMAKVTHYPLVYEDGWRVDFDGLQAAATERTQALVVVNPNNPTGSFLKDSELEQLVRFCAERKLAIISDEVFSPYGFGEDPHRITSLRGVRDVLTFCLGGLSKMAGMPQMKLGWMTVNGPAELRRQALTRLELIADTYLSVGTPVQVAAKELLRLGEGIRTAISARTLRNLHALQKLMGSDSPFRVRKVEGGWYAVVEVPKVRTEEEWVLELLEKHNVLVQPGFFYDFDREAFLVLSLLSPEEVFDAGTAKIVVSA